MTAPDVNALAAALLQPMRPALEDLGIEENEREWCDGMAGLIIATLAAQGWRITSAPEASEAAHYSIGGKGVANGGNIPVSAQAAPDCCGGCVCEVPHGDALRAALEGLRAEVASLRYAGEDDRDNAVLVAINKRLADLT